MRLLTAASVFALLAGALFASGPVRAQAFYERTKPTADCPTIVLHLERNGSAISGVEFYADGSGVSSVKGSEDGNGNLKWTLTRLSGKGPSGVVVGTYAADGTMKLTNTNTHCTFAENVTPWRSGE